MKLPSLTTLGTVMLVSELALMFARRSKTDSTDKDRFTLPLLWLVIGASITLGFFLRAAYPRGRLPFAEAFYIAGLIAFVIGLIIRWIAILHLGRFFTVDVAIAKDHQLITTGPYRYVRHPSYTGTLLFFLGFSVCLLNVASILVIMIPVTAAFLWRIHVEEQALRQAFGRTYESYAAQTARVLPLLW